MKRMTAMLLAVALLFTGMTALAASFGTQLDLTSIRMSLIGSENKDVARLHGLGLTVTVGSTGGVPTLQVTLHYGENQQLDSVAQIVDNKLLVCLGGVSGTFYADLDDLFGQGQGKLVSGAIGSALLMFGSNPKMMLQMALPIRKSGAHRRTISIPAEDYRKFIEPLVLALENTEALREEDEASLNRTVSDSDEDYRLYLRYNPSSDSLRIKLTQGGKGIYLRGKLKIDKAPLELINISQDEVKYNLLDLDETVLEELRGELEYMGFKMDSFVENSNMRKLTQDAE